MSLNATLSCSGLGALPQCWLALATCTAFCAELYGNASVGCGVATWLCAPSDAAAVTAPSSSNATLAVVAAPGGAFTCLQPPAADTNDDADSTTSYVALGVGYAFLHALLLFSVLHSFAGYCASLWPAGIPLLSDFGAMSEVLRGVRESVRAVRLKRGGSGRLKPPAQLSWAQSAKLDTCLSSMEQAAERSLVSGKARLVDLALLGQWEALEDRLLAGNDNDAGPDDFGWLPLHHAARLGAPLTTFSLLLEAYPGATVAYTVDALDGFAPVVRATEMQLMLLLAVGAAAICSMPLAVALSVATSLHPVIATIICCSAGLVAFVVTILCLVGCSPVPFHLGDMCCIEPNVQFSGELELWGAQEGATTGRLHRATTALNKRMPDRLKGRAWVHPAAVRTPLGVAADALQRALLAHCPDAVQFAEAVRALAWAAPHTLLRTSMVNTAFGRALLRDIVLSDGALLWRPYSDAAGSSCTLSQLAMIARVEELRSDPAPTRTTSNMEKLRREPKGAPDMDTLFTLMDLHRLFGVPPPPELLQALPELPPDRSFRLHQRALDHYEELQDHAAGAERERETVLDRAYALTCAPVYTAVEGKPVLLGEGGFAQVMLYRRHEVPCYSGHVGVTPAGTERLWWRQPYSPGVAVKIYSAIATKELDTYATKELERTVPGGARAVDAPNSGARIAALLNETLLLRMMNHPHVVRFLAARVENDRLELFVQLAPGGDLHSAFANAAKHVRWREQGARLAREAAAGLRYLHEEYRQAHRDLKPKNILLSGPLPAGSVLLADFGISADALRPRAPDGMRTEAWAAPETDPKRGGDYNLFTADIYSLGLIIRKLITGTAGVHDLDDLECPWCKIDSELAEKGILKKPRLRQRAAQCAHTPPDKGRVVESSQLTALLDDAGAILVDMCCSECKQAACSLAAAALACAATQHAPAFRPSLAKLCARLKECEPLLIEQATAQEAAGDDGGDQLAPHVSSGSSTEVLEQVTVEY
jgi:serine/threonine protein kinase